MPGRSAAARRRDKERRRKKKEIKSQDIINYSKKENERKTSEENQANV